MKEQKIINVVVILFPDGEIYWIKDDDMARKNLDERINQWKERADKKYHNPNLSSCVAHVSMYENDYFKIPATN